MGNWWPWGSKTTVYVCKCGATLEQPGYIAGKADNIRCNKCAREGRLCGITTVTCLTCKGIQEVGDKRISQLLADVGGIHCDKCSDVLRAKVDKGEYKVFEYLVGGEKRSLTYPKELESKILADQVPALKQ